MRAVFAGVSVFACLMLAVGLLSDMAQHMSPIIFGVGMAGLFFVLVISALILFNRPDGKLREDAWLENLEAQGLFVSTEFKAIRAFQVEEQEDEGLHYFIELADGPVLYLTGQYLYDYEPVEDFQLNLPRRFPCSEFAVRTHRDEKFAADIQCRGKVIEPAYVAPCPKDYWKWEPEDGQVIAGETYDEIKQRVVTAAQTRPR